MKWSIIGRMLVSFRLQQHTMYRTVRGGNEIVKIHIVQKGDTLWKLAKKYGVDFEKLKAANTQLSNPDMIMPGMKIKIPTGSIPVKKEAPVAGAPHMKEQPYQKEGLKPPPTTVAPLGKEAPQPLPQPMPMPMPQMKMPQPMPQPQPIMPQPNMYEANMNVFLYQPQAKPMPQPMPAPAVQKPPIPKKVEPKKEMVKPKEVVKPAKKEQPMPTPSQPPKQPQMQQPTYQPQMKMQPSMQPPMFANQQFTGQQQPQQMQPSIQPQMLPNQPQMSQPVLQTQQQPIYQQPVQQPSYYPYDSSCWQPISPVMPGCAPCGPMYPQQMMPMQQYPQPMMQPTYEQMGQPNMPFYPQSSQMPQAQQAFENDWMNYGAMQPQMYDPNIQMMQAHGFENNQPMPYREEDDYED